MHRIGEWSMFVYMWTTDDFNAGYVTRCPQCSDPSAIVNQVYQQPSYERCPTCFGALYAGAHGGVKAIQVRPALWQFEEKDIKFLSRGEIEPQAASVITTGDVRLFTRDYIFRSDGNRFGVNGVQAVHLQAGFGTPAHTMSALTSSYTVGRENESSPAYMIPPAVASLETIIGTDNQRFIPSFSANDFSDSPVPLAV